MRPDQLTAHADGKLLAGVVDRVGHVVINNPERHNAISLDMYRTGAAEVARMADDPETRLLVIRGCRRQGFRVGRRHLEIRKGTFERRGCRNLRAGKQVVL